jgi:DNA-binding transcriptional LysR family regulator
MLELRDLRRFATLAEDCHFGRAAERLGMGQPQLSRALQRLERQVGTRLLARTSREVTPTEAGLALLEDARRLLAIAEAAPARALRRRAARAARWALGFSGSCAYAFLPAASRVSGGAARHRADTAGCRRRGRWRNCGRGAWTCACGRAARVPEASCRRAGV